GEHSSGRLMNGQPQLIAMPHRKDLGTRASFTDERIVRRNLAVFSQTKNFSVDCVGALRLLVEWRTRRHVDEAAAECEARPARTTVPVAGEQLFDVGESLAIELAARKCHGALALIGIRSRLAGLVVREVHKT